MEYSLKLLNDNLNENTELLENCKNKINRFPPHIKEQAIKSYNRKIADLKNGIKTLTIASK
jgi:hypothetical protein